MDKLEEIKFNSFETNEAIKSIEIPKEEILVFNSIKDLVNQISEKELIDFDGPIHYAAGTADKLEEISKAKKLVIQNNDNLNQDQKDDLFWYAKREAEYEACKDVIDYKNNQLNQVLELIEKQNIWKAKFSTLSGVNYSHWHHDNMENFIKDLEETGETYKKTSFAGQNIDSIYFLSKSGVSVRIKTVNLFAGDGIRSAVQNPCELSFCINDVVMEENKIYEDYKYKTGKYPKELVSFEPKLGYRVEEFATKEFRDCTDGDFISKIKVVQDDKDIVIKDYTNDHFGHCINKIFYSNSSNEAS